MITNKHAGVYDNWNIVIVIYDLCLISVGPLILTWISETSTECKAWISDYINKKTRNYLSMP